MSENQVILYGNVGTAVDYRDNKGFARAMFRVGSTPRWYDRQRGEWRDLETVWMTVKVTRSLAKNASSSLKLGDPVIVIGRIRTHVWEDDDTKEVHRRDVLEAHAVCHDLSRGTTAYQRNERTEPATEPAESEAESVRTFEQQHQATSLSA